MNAAPELSPGCRVKIATAESTYRGRRGTIIRQNVRRPGQTIERWMVRVDDDKFEEVSFWATELEVKVNPAAGA